MWSRFVRGYAMSENVNGADSSVITGSVLTCSAQ